MIKIEKGLPLERAKRGSKYPFAEMKVGDSFLVKCGKKAAISRRNAIWRAYNTYWQSNPKVTFSIRKVEGGLRVWRVK